MPFPDFSRDYVKYEGALRAYHDYISELTNGTGTKILEQDGKPVLSTIRKLRYEDLVHLVCVQRMIDMGHTKGAAPLIKGETIPGPSVPTELLKLIGLVDLLDFGEILDRRYIVEPGTFNQTSGRLMRAYFNGKPATPASVPPVAQTTIGEFVNIPKTTYDKLSKALSNLKVAVTLAGQAWDDILK